jgi:hypothetical protein
MCIVALGTPVVPDVKANRQQSSAAVSSVAKRPVAGTAEQTDRAQRLARRGHLLQRTGKPGIAERMRDPRLGDDRTELGGAQQRHRRHGDAAGLHHREPARGEHRRIGAAQQHAIAGHQPHVPDEHMGDPVSLVPQIRIGPAQPAGRADADAVAASFGDVAVEKLGGAVQLVGKSQLRQLEQELRLLLGRRKIVAGEAVEMGGWHAGPPDEPGVRSRPRRAGRAGSRGR